MKKTLPGRLDPRHRPTTQDKPTPCDGLIPRLRRSPRPWTPAAICLVLAMCLSVASVSPAAAQTLIPGKQGELKKAKPSYDLKDRIDEKKAELKENEKKDEHGIVVIEKAPYDPLANTDEITHLALAAFCSKYCIGLNVNDGDWVRYQHTRGGVTSTVELRISREENGNTWLVRTDTGADGTTETHMLFAAGKPQLLEAYRVTDSGDIEPIAVPDPIETGLAFSERREAAIEALGQGSLSGIRVEACAGTEPLTGPFGAMNCRCLEVLIPGQVNRLSMSSMRPIEEEGTKLWFNAAVPRIIPYDAIVLPVLISPDDTMTVQGGMVRSTYYELIDWSR
jgi:hypothetical protein